MNKLRVKNLTSFMFFVLTVLSLGLYYFYPPCIRAAVWDISEGGFGSISFSVALFAFPLIYWVANMQKLKWLGFLVTFFDVTIVLYLLMWMRSAVYWSPLVICFFNYVLVGCIARGRTGFLTKYEDLFSAYITSTYLAGGALSFFLWILFRILD